MFLLWHPWLTTTNLSYSFPLLETSATALCGTTGTLCYRLLLVYNFCTAINFNILLYWVWEPLKACYSVYPENPPRTLQWICLNLYRQPQNDATGLRELGLSEFCCKIIHRINVWYFLPTNLPQKSTRLPETNSKFAPENGWLEYFFVSFWGVKRPIFRGKPFLGPRAGGSTCSGWDATAAGSKDWPCLTEDRLESYDLALASDVAWRVKKNHLYFEWSPPWHVTCRVGVGPVRVVKQIMSGAGIL